MSHAGQAVGAALKKGVLVKTLGELIRSDKGMETVEWALLGALIVAVVITSAVPLGAAVKASFERLSAIGSP